MRQARIAQPKATPSHRKTATAPRRSSRRGDTPGANHRLAGAPADVAAVVEHGRSAPAARSPHVAPVAREFGLTESALELHAGGAARLACGWIGARAFAVQNVVVFAEPAPSLALVRHELAHVVQQGGMARPAPDRYSLGALSLGRADSDAEREAALAAREAAGVTLRPSPVAVQRDGEDPDGDGTPEPTPVGRERARQRLRTLAESTAFVVMTAEQKDTTKFGLAQAAGDAATYDPVFLVSSAAIWTVNDFMAANNLNTEDEKQKRNARGDVSDYIFKRQSKKAATLAQNSVAKQAFKISRSASANTEQIIWAVRTIPGGVLPTADPDTQTTRYAFVGTYLKGGTASPIAEGADVAGFEIVNEIARPLRSVADPLVSLSAYKKIISEIKRVSDSAKPAKKTPLEGAQDQIKAIDDAIKAATALTNEDEKAKALVKAGETARESLKTWLLAQFTLFDELNRILLDDTKKTLIGTEDQPTESGGTEKKPFNYVTNWNPIKGDVLVKFIDSKKGEGIALGAEQVYFGKDEAKGLKEDAQGDGFIKIGSEYRILESKAVGSGPGDRETIQMRRYAVIIKGAIPGWLSRPQPKPKTPVDDKPVDPWQKIEKFTIAEYYLGLSLPDPNPADGETSEADDKPLKIAKEWNNALYKAFTDPTGAQDIKIPAESAVHAQGYLIHPNVTGDPAKLTTIQLNPLLTLPINDPKRIDQSITNLATKQPGSKIRSATFKLARPLEAEIASGTIVIELDLGGAVQSPTEPAAKTMRPIPATEAKPAKPGGPLVFGTVENKFDKLTSSLDKFLKERVTTDAKLTGDGAVGNGVEASVRVSKGPSGIPNVTLDEALIAVTFGTRGLAAKGRLGLSNDKGTVRGAVEVTWNTAAKNWKVVGTATFTDLVDGLKPIEAVFTYDQATDKKTIEAKQVGIEKQYHGIRLVGTATNLVMDVDKGEFSGAADLRADLGAFGEASATATIVQNQIQSAELAYKTPKLRYPKSGNAALTGDLGGKVTYTAGKAPGEAPTFSGDITVNAEIQAAPLKKLAKDGKLAVGGTVHIAADGTLSGSIGTQTELKLGEHFRIPSIDAQVDPNGAFTMGFSIEVVGIGPMKDAKVGAKIDEHGFTITGANVEFTFPRGNGNVWGSLSVLFAPGRKEGELTIGGAINVQIKEGMVAHGNAIYNVSTGRVDATLSIDEITLLKYGPKIHSLVDFSKQVELISFYKVIGIYLDAGFELAFAYEFDLRLNPKISLEGFSFSTFQFSRAIAVMRLLGGMSATLSGTPKIGLGLFVISTSLLRGGGGLKVPITARAALALDPPVELHVTYTPEGGVSAGGTAGLTLLFGVTGAVTPYAEFNVLDGVYDYQWTGADLTSFTLLKERPIFTYVVNFGKPLTTETNPKIPSGKDAPAQPATAQSVDGRPGGSTQLTAADKTDTAKQQSPEDKPKATNDGGFDLLGMVSGLLDGASFRPFRALADSAAEVWDALSNFVGRIIKFVRNWVGGAIDTITNAIKGIGKKGLIGYMRDLLQARLHPALFHILEPMLDALGKVEEDIYDLLDMKLPTSVSELIEFVVTIIKKAIKMAWDDLPGLLLALKEMMSRAVDATREFAQYLVDTGHLGVSRSVRYIGSETVGLAHYFLVADRYKIHFAGVDIDEKDDTVWPSADKAIGFGLWHLLDELGVTPTYTAIASDADEPYNDYWVSRIQRWGRNARGLSPDAPAAVWDAATEGGAPMSPASRHRYESALGGDLADIRLHTGPKSAHAAEALDARAYTIGRHIHFGAAEFAPETHSGDLLLAHELVHAHVAPQAPRRRYGFDVEPASAESERRAYAAAPHLVG